MQWCSFWYDCLWYYYNDEVFSMRPDILTWPVFCRPSMQMCLTSYSVWPDEVTETILMSVWWRALLICDMEMSSCEGYCLSLPSTSEVWNAGGNAVEADQKGLRENEKPVAFLRRHEMTGIYNEAEKWPLYRNEAYNDVERLLKWQYKAHLYRRSSGLLNANANQKWPKW